MDKLSYHRHRYPSIVIQQAIWLYFRFALSYRDVEDMLAERGIDVSYETVRRRALKFGAIIARKLRRGWSRPDVRWHLDEVFVSVDAEQLYVWACRGQRRRDPGHPGSGTARPQGGAQADAKTPEEVWRHSSHHRDR